MLCPTMLVLQTVSAALITQTGYVNIQCDKLKEI